MTGCCCRWCTQRRRGLYSSGTRQASVALTQRQATCAQSPRHLPGCSAASNPRGGLPTQIMQHTCIIIMHLLHAPCGGRRTTMRRQDFQYSIFHSLSSKPRPGINFPDCLPRSLCSVCRLERRPCQRLEARGMRQERTVHVDGAPLIKTPGAQGPSEALPLWVRHSRWTRCIDVCVHVQAGVTARQRRGALLTDAQADGDGAQRGDAGAVFRDGPGRGRSPHQAAPEAAAAAAAAPPAPHHHSLQRHRPQGSPHQSNLTGFWYLWIQNARALRGLSLVAFSVAVAG